MAKRGVEWTLMKNVRPDSDIGVTEVFVGSRDHR